MVLFLWLFSFGWFCTCEVLGFWCFKESENMNKGNPFLFRMDFKVAFYNVIC